MEPNIKWNFQICFSVPLKSIHFYMMGWLQGVRQWSWISTGQWHGARNNKRWKKCKNIIYLEITQHCSAKPIKTREDKRSSQCWHYRKFILFRYWPLLCCHKILRRCQHLKKSFSLQVKHLDSTRIRNVDISWQWLLLIYVLQINYLFSIWVSNICWNGYCACV